MTLQEILCGMVDCGKVPHAIMLHEDDGGGALSIALEFLKHLYNDDNKVVKMIHPDVHFIFPVVSGTFSESYGREWRDLALSNPAFTENDLNERLGMEGRLPLIAVPEAKLLLEKMSLSALEGGYRSAVIYLPERMNQEAANRLLKLIEEPPAKTQFILITHYPEKVLATISSRCQRMRVPPRERRKPDLRFEEFSSLMDNLAGKNLPAALEVGDSLSSLPSRESSKAFCKFAGERLRSVFLIQQGVTALAGEDGEAEIWARTFGKDFPRAAMSDFDRAVQMIDRNVNLKILFTDLVDRLYLHIA